MDTGEQRELIAAAQHLLRPHRIAGRLFGDVAAVVALWRDEDGRLHALPPCGRCLEFLRQVDPANLDTVVLLGNGRSLPLRELLPEHDWPRPVGEPTQLERSIDAGRRRRTTRLTSGPRPARSHIPVRMGRFTR